MTEVNHCYVDNCVFWKKIKDDMGYCSKDTISIGHVNICLDAQKRPCTFHGG